MGDGTSDSDRSSLESRLLTAPEFFTRSQIHSLISCNIKPPDAMGKYSDVRMAKALSVIEPYLMEDEESDEVDVEYSYQVYAVKRERTASFFFRPLYHASELSVLHRPCTEEAVLLEAEVLRHSSSHVLSELFSKSNYSGRLVFEAWWHYSLCRLNYMAKRLDTVSLNELKSYTSVRILIALIRFYDRCLADNWSALFPDRRLTATERIQDLQRIHRLDVIENINLARKVIDDCGKPELLDSALVDLERQVAMEKRSVSQSTAQAVSHQASAVHPHLIHAQGSIPGPSAWQTTVFSQSSASQSTASAISHEYIAPDEKPLPEYFHEQWLYPSQ
mmetsp:Transcript_23889/g.54684  ORF Transcript_23889/g.54684 Transcript_23889/m.54684 type:complete len:333 (+) Transcript_23889:252-1250(+)